MNPETFDDMVSRVYEADFRFDTDAYYFLRDALDRTARTLGRDGPKAENRHLSGAELAAGFRDCMLEDFGPMAATVAEDWGLEKSDDIGAMVYNLIEAGAFGKAPTDRRTDFNGLFNLIDDLEAPYLPATLKPKTIAPKTRSSSKRKETP